MEQDKYKKKTNKVSAVAFNISDDIMQKLEMEHIYNDKLEILKAYNNLTRNGKLIINQEVIARSRLRVDSRKWIASKLKPKRFGDYTKIQAEVKDTSSTSSWLGEVLSEIDNNK